MAALRFGGPVVGCQRLFTVHRDGERVGVCGAWVGAGCLSAARQGIPAMPLTRAMLRRLLPAAAARAKAKAKAKAEAAPAPTTAMKKKKAGKTTMATRPVQSCFLACASHLLDARSSVSLRHVMCLGCFDCMHMLITVGDCVFWVCVRLRPTAPAACRPRCSSGEGTQTEPRLDLACPTAGVSPPSYSAVFSQFSQAAGLLSAKSCCDRFRTRFAHSCHFTMHPVARVKSTGRG